MIPIKVQEREEAPSLQSWKFFIKERRFELCPELCYSLEEVFLGWGGRIAHGTCDRGLHSQWNVEGGRQVR